VVGGQRPPEQLERLTLEYDSGKTIILEREALAVWETTYQQGLAALYQLSMIQQQIALKQQEEAEAPPAPSSAATVEGEPLTTLKQALAEREAKK
jgi:hypothetical protein